MPHAGSGKAIDTGMLVKLGLMMGFKWPVTVAGIIMALMGVGVQMSAISDKYGRNPQPVTAEDFWYAILAGLALVIGGFALILLGVFMRKKRNEVFKKDIVRKRLECDFEISDYIYNSNSNNKISTFTLLYSLNIRNNCWNIIEYNDYFVGKYHGAPFLFFDCKLYNMVISGKSSTDYLLFSGQVVILKLSKPVDFSCQFAFDDDCDGIDVEPCHSNLNLFEPLLNGEHTLDDLLKSQNQESEPPGCIRSDGEAMYDARCYLQPMHAHLIEAVQNARCHVGWVLNGSYLAIILENGFDPFEYGFKDLFISGDKISNRVDKQVQWLCSILEPHVRAGLI